MEKLTKDSFNILWVIITNEFIVSFFLEKFWIHVNAKLYLFVNNLLNLHRKKIVDSRKKFLNQKIIVNNLNIFNQDKKLNKFIIGLTLVLYK